MLSVYAKLSCRLLAVRERELQYARNCVYLSKIEKSSSVKIVQCQGVLSSQNRNPVTFPWRPLTMHSMCGFSFLPLVFDSATFFFFIFAESSASFPRRPYPWWICKTFRVLSGLWMYSRYRDIYVTNTKYGHAWQRKGFHPPPHWGQLSSPIMEEKNQKQSLHYWIHMIVNGKEFI